MSVGKKAQVKMRVKKLRSFRSAPRRSIEPIQVSSLSSMETLVKLARAGEIIEASVTGFKVRIQRADFIPKELRQNLTIDSLVGTRVLLYLPQMNLEIAGKVTRTKLMGKSGYEIGVDFSDDAPEYWRECLFELLPSPGELD